MKKTRFLGVTTLAGALLFTGVGHQAHAAQTVNDSNVQDYAKNTIGSKYTEAGDVSVAGKADGGIKDKGNYYEVTFSGEKDNGINRAKVYKEDGRVVGRTPRMGPDEKEIVFAEGQNQNTQNQSKSEVVGTDEDGKTQQNNDKQTQATDNNATTQNNTQSQSQAQVLPETGKAEVNSGLVTSIAAILLAAGSLLTFKRFSKEK